MSPQNADSEHDPVYSGGSYGETRYSGSLPHGTTTTVPWRLNNIRIDGFVGGIPTAVPGQGATYTAVLLPSDAFEPMGDRHEKLRQYAYNGPFVTFWQTQGECHYREQHKAPDGSQLAYIGPLDPDHRAAGTVDDPPPGRPSAFESRYVVVTNVSQSGTTLPEVSVTLDIEATTIARGSQFATREDVRDAREHNGFH